MISVLDASVAFKWVVQEPGSNSADRLRVEALQGLRDFVAPDCFATEIAHALTRAERRGFVKHADSLWIDVMRTAPRLFPTLSLIPRALEIASRHRIGVYDCIYVALAEREGCELITADERLVRNLGTAFPFVVALDFLP